MRAHYFQHVLFEGLGSIEPWLVAAGAEITSTRFFESPRLPIMDEIDLLVVMGGPMSVNDETSCPWLSIEKRFIREMIREGKPVLGICLGAQLIASALGARVYKSPVKEIGWFPVRGNVGENSSTFHFPAATTVFHWHGETFDMPQGARLLASSEGCQNQAFQIGSSVIGLQFHLETTPESARKLVIHCGDELVPSRYVQTKNEVLSFPKGGYEVINHKMGEVLSYLLRHR